MKTQSSFSEYIQARSLLLDLHQDPNKKLLLFKQAISDLNKPIFFSVLLNEFIVSLDDNYLSNIRVFSDILKYCIQYDNIYAFRLMLSLPRQDLILENTIDLDRKESILMLIALYGSLDILQISLKYFSSVSINQKNILGETALHYAIKNNNQFSKEKTIDYLLNLGADPDFPYEGDITLREKILQIKATGIKKVNFILCYQSHCLKNTNPIKHSIARLPYDAIKNIFRLIG